MSSLTCRRLHVILTRTRKFPRAPWLAPCSSKPLSRGARKLIPGAFSHHAASAYYLKSQRVMTRADFVRLCLLAPDGRPRREYSVPGRGRFVEAVRGEAYGIRVDNMCAWRVKVRITVDGRRINTLTLCPHESKVVTEVVSRLEELGGGRQLAHYRPLLFSQPTVVEEGSRHEKLVTGGEAEKLGVVEAAVYEVVPKPYGTPIIRTAVGEDVFRVAVTEKEGNKKGAFRSTSGLGQETRREEKRPRLSFDDRGRFLSSVACRYGSRALLLRVGVPPGYFMMPVHRATPRPVLIDLTSEGEGMAGPAAKRIKREAGSSSSSQPPPPAAVVDLTA